MRKRRPTSALRSIPRVTTFRLASAYASWPAPGSTSSSKTSASIRVRSYPEPEPPAGVKVPAFAAYRSPDSPRPASASACSTSRIGPLAACATAIAMTSSSKVRLAGGRWQRGVEPRDDVALPHRQIPGRPADQGWVRGTEHDPSRGAEHQHRDLTGLGVVDHPDPVPGPVEALRAGNRHQAEPATGQPAPPPRDGLRQVEPAHPTWAIGTSMTEAKQAAKDRVRVGASPRSSGRATSSTPTS